MAHSVLVKGMGRSRLVALAVAAVAVLAATACEPAPIPTAPGTKRVVIFGDSVPNWALRDGKAGIDASKYTVIDGTIPACEGVKDAPPARSRSGALLPMTAECKPGWPTHYPPELTLPTDVAIVMAGGHAMLDHQLSGTWRHPCHTPFKTWYQADLEARFALLKTKATKVVVVLPAWPGANSGWIMPADHAKRADCVRATTRAAAAAKGVTVVDLGAYLCPTGSASCNAWRSGDGIHLDANRAATVVRWLLGQALPPV